MRSFSIRSLGCKVNQYEGQQIRQFLEDRGLIRVHDIQQADLLILNTCAVTATASAKARQYLHKALRQNPTATIVVCGCLPALGGKESPDPADRIVIITTKDQLPERLLGLISHKTNPNEDIIRPSAEFQANPQTGSLRLPDLPCFSDHCRAFLKVQDGCDGTCSYCVVPMVRSRIHSKPLPLVLDEARALVDAGHKEIVVVGANLGAYGQDTVIHSRWPGHYNPSFIELIDRLAQVPGLLRLRLSSVDPSDINERLLEVMVRHPNVMPHLHLAIQSGSDRILRAMSRQYNTEDVRQAVEMVRAYLAEPAITTDMIIGFPSETEEDFKKTVELAMQLGLARIHVFAYSPRPGTKAANLPGRVRQGLVKSRCAQLIHLQRELGRQFRARFVGKTAEVLIEHCSNTHAFGLSERYFGVYVQYNGPKMACNQILKVRLVEDRDDGMIGRPCRTEANKDVAQTLPNLR